MLTDFSASWKPCTLLPNTLRSYRYAATLIMCSHSVNGNNIQIGRMVHRLTAFIRLSAALVRWMMRNLSSTDLDSRVVWTSMSVAALMNTTTVGIAASCLVDIALSNSSVPFSSIYNVSNGMPINGSARCSRFDTSYVAQTR